MRIHCDTGANVHTFVKVFSQVIVSILFHIYIFSKVKYSFTRSPTVFYSCLPHKYINFIIETVIQRSAGRKLYCLLYYSPDFDLI